MIQSGFAPLDFQLGGLHPGRLHLLTGGPGSGKTSACLQFLDAGVRADEPGLLITLDRVDDLVGHARALRIDIEAPVRSQRLLIARYRANFASLVEAAAVPASVIDDIGDMIVEIRPKRMVVDPITPFVSERIAGSALASLVRLVEDLGVCALFTYPNDVSNGYDARLTPVVHSAAAIVHLTQGSANGARVIQSRTRGTPRPAHERDTLPRQTGRNRPRQREVST